MNRQRKLQASAWLVANELTELTSCANIMHEAIKSVLADELIPLPLGVRISLDLALRQFSKFTDAEKEIA